MRKMKFIKYSKELVVQLVASLGMFLWLALPAYADSVSQTVTVLIPPGMEHLGRIPVPPQAGGVALSISVGAPTIVARLQHLPQSLLADIPIMASTFGLKKETLVEKVFELTPTIQAQVRSSTGVELAGRLGVPLTVTLGAVGVRNPELSTPRGMAGFIRDLVTVVGKPVLQEAMVDARKAEFTVKMATSIALGHPIDRRTFDQEFSGLGAVLLAREQEMIRSGDFQAFFRRNPRTAADWEMVKAVAYRVRELPEVRKTAREVIARRKYERVFKINIASLAQSTAHSDQERVARAWSFIRAIASSNLRI